ncbi:hypothetical protein HBB16_11550 [Pseudonocardia sp. MCCB 268]|nr:hypothetical protein [Pseudonocardia cytotoxica]
MLLALPLTASSRAAAAVPAADRHGAGERRRREVLMHAGCASPTRSPTTPYQPAGHGRGAGALVPGQDVLPPLTLAVAVVGLRACRPLGADPGGRGRPRPVAGAAQRRDVTTARWQDLRYLQPFPLLVVLFQWCSARARLGTDRPAARHPRGWGCCSP